MPLAPLLLSKEFSFPVFLTNLRELQSLRWIKSNIERKGLGQVLLNELSPRCWLSAEERLAWVWMQPELHGWLSHILIGAAIYAFLGVSPLGIVLLAAGLEIHFFVSVNAGFLNPLNAILDIFFYWLGVRLGQKALDAYTPKRGRLASWQGIFLFLFAILMRKVTVTMARTLDPPIFHALGPALFLTILFYLVIRLRPLHSSAKRLLLGVMALYVLWEIQGLSHLAYPYWSAENAWSMSFLFLFLWGIRRATTGVASHT